MQHTALPQGWWNVRGSDESIESVLKELRARSDVPTKIAYSTLPKLALAVTKVANLRGVLEDFADTARGKEAATTQRMLTKVSGIAEAVLLNSANQENLSEQWQQQLKGDRAERLINKNKMSAIKKELSVLEKAHKEAEEKALKHELAVMKQSLDEAEEEALKHELAVMKKAHDEIEKAKELEIKEAEKKEKFFKDLVHKSIHKAGHMVGNEVKKYAVKKVKESWKNRKR